MAHCKLLVLEVLLVSVLRATGYYFNAISSHLLDQVLLLMLSAPSWLNFITHSSISLLFTSLHRKGLISLERTCIKGAANYMWVESND